MTDSSPLSVVGHLMHVINRIGTCSLFIRSIAITIIIPAESDRVGTVAMIGPRPQQSTETEARAQGQQHQWRYGHSAGAHAGERCEKGKVIAGMAIETRSRRRRRRTQAMHCLPDTPQQQQQMRMIMTTICLELPTVRISSTVSLCLCWCAWARETKPKLFAIIVKGN